MQRVHMLCHSVGMLVCHTRSMYAGSWMQVCSFHLGSLRMYMHVLLACVCVCVYIYIYIYICVCVCVCTPAHAGKGQRFDQEASMPLPQLQQPMPALRSWACASANAGSEFHLFLSKSIACALLGLSYPVLCKGAARMRDVWISSTFWSFRSTASARS